MSPKHDGTDRDAILARRALLVSSALAAFSCSGPERGAQSSTAAPSTSESAESAASATARPRRGEAPKPLRPWSEVMAKAPPFGVPSQLAGLEQANLKRSEESLQLRYKEVQAVWEAVPSCDPQDPACRPAWRAIGEGIKKLFDRTRHGIGGFGGCGEPSGNSASVVARRSAHDRYTKSVVDELETQLSAMAATMSPQGEQEWLRLLANAKVVPPMPCLSPCAMPEVSELYQSVSFVRDAATLGERATVENVATIYKGNRKASTIEVRGHAGKDEKDPASLAKARAQAVADALIKAGVPKASVRVTSFGADYPVVRSDENGGDANQRVDFLAVPQP